MLVNCKIPIYAYTIFIKIKGSYQSWLIQPLASVRIDFWGVGNLDCTIQIGDVMGSKR